MVLLVFLGVLATSTPDDHAATRDLVTVKPLYELQDQAVTKRQWVDVKLQRVKYLSEGAEYMLYRTTRVRVDKEGSFYALDTGDQHVKKFSAAGKYERLFGAGQGEGPGEFKGLIDLVVDPAGKLWMLDILRRRLNRFDADGVLETSFPVATKGMPKRFVLHPDNTPIVMTHGGSQYLFHRFYRDGEVLQSFGELIKDQTSMFIALDGFMRAGKEGFIYAPNRAGHLLRFDFDGNLRYAIKTMDDIPYPKVELKYKDGQLWAFKPVPLRRFATGDLSVLGEEIFCYSFEASTANERVIDVYRYADGAYQYSFKLSFKFDFFEITEEYFITIARSGAVTIWER